MYGTTGLNGSVRNNGKLSIQRTEQYWNNVDIFPEMTCRESKKERHFAKLKALHTIFLMKVLYKKLVLGKPND